MSEVKTAAELFAQAQAVCETVNQVIPLARATAFELQAYDGQSLKIRAPLANNINDKGTGFAGSIATLGVLCGWYASTLAALQQFARVDVAAVKTDLHYQKPIHGDIVAEVKEISLAAREQLWESLQKKGRGRFHAKVELGDGEEVCAVFSGDYYVRLISDELSD